MRGFAFKVYENTMKRCSWAGVPTSVAPGSEATMAAVTTGGAGPRSRGTRAHWPHRARRAHGAGRAAGRRRGPALHTPRTASL